MFKIFKWVLEVVDREFVYVNVEFAFKAHPSKRTRRRVEAAGGLVYVIYIRINFNCIKLIYFYS